MIDAAPFMIHIYHRASGITANIILQKDKIQEILGQHCSWQIAGPMHGSFDTIQLALQCATMCMCAYKCRYVKHQPSTIEVSTPLQEDSILAPKNLGNFWGSAL